MNDPITVLLVDDHEVVRQGVRAFLEAHSEFAVVGEAASGAAAEKGCLRCRWRPLRSSFS